MKKKKLKEFVHKKVHPFFLEITKKGYEDSNYFYSSYKKRDSRHSLKRRRKAKIKEKEGFSNNHYTTRE